MKLNDILKEILQESKSVDIMYIKKEIQKYNKGQIRMGQLVLSILYQTPAHTGVKHPNKILDALKDHIVNSTEDDKVPTDIAEELYDICIDMVK